MFRRMTYVLGILFLAQITHVVASDDVPTASSKDLPRYLAMGLGAEMEKCFGLPAASQESAPRILIPTMQCIPRMVRRY